MVHSHRLSSEIFECFSSALNYHKTVRIKFGTKMRDKYSEVLKTIEEEIQNEIIEN